VLLELALHKRCEHTCVCQHHKTNQMECADMCTRAPTAMCTLTRQSISLRMKLSWLLIRRVRSVFTRDGMAELWVLQ
jgi:hypothetical protein